MGQLRWVPHWAGGAIAKKSTLQMRERRFRPNEANVHDFRGCARTGEERHLLFTVVSISTRWAAGSRTLGQLMLG